MLQGKEVIQLHHPAGTNAKTPDAHICGCLSHARSFPGGKRGY